MLSSCMVKIKNKQKSCSFNLILRAKHKNKNIDFFICRLNKFIKSKVYFGFSSLKYFANNKKNKILIKLILLFQTFQEKIKYRSVIRGFNSFKASIFNKSMASDINKSTCSKSKPSIFITPPSESPILNISQELLKLERPVGQSLNPNNQRRLSFYSLKYPISKKNPEKATQEPGLSKLNLCDKTKTKESNFTKRLAYDESLKDRKKKKIIKPATTSNMISKKKNQTIFDKKIIQSTTSDLKT